MKLLFIASNEHLSGSGGGATSARNILSSLQRSFPPGALQVMRLPCVAEKLPRKLRQLIALLRSIGSPYSSKFHFLAPPDWRDRINKAIADAVPDLVIVNGADLLPLLSITGSRPTALIAHNIEYRLMQEQVARLSVPVPAFRNFLYRDCRKMQAVETGLAGNVRNVLTLSADDADYFRSLSGDMNVATIGAAFGYQPYRRTPRAVARPIHVAFLAKMSWWPNLEAARWYVTEVLSRLPPGRVITHFYGPGSEVFRDAHPELRVHGFVEDLREVWGSADFVICPIRSGSGVNIKFMEALYNRMPVLATPMAARGLRLPEHPSIIYRDSAEAWSGFLAGPEAEALARSQVPDQIGDMFASEHQMAALKQFFGRILESCDTPDTAL